MAEPFESLPFPGTSLWLELRWQGKSRVFECPAQRERAIVVGSQPRADLRIEALDVAPVHFHLEREGAHVLLVPAYAGELRVNAGRVQGPIAIAGRALIEFSSQRLELVVHESRPDVEEWPSLDIPERESGIAYLTALPSDAQTTQLALQQYASAENFQAAIQTSEISRDALARDWGLQTARLERPPIAAETTKELAPVSPAPEVTKDIGPVRRPAEVTQELRPVFPHAPPAEVTQDLLPAVRAEVTQAMPPLRMPLAQATMRLERPSFVPAAAVPALPPTPAVAPAAAAAPAPAAAAAPATAIDTDWQRTTAFDMESLQAEPIRVLPAPVKLTSSAPPPPRESQAPARPAHQVESTLPSLTRQAQARKPKSAFKRVTVWLGKQAKARPLAVGAGALGGAVALSLMLLGLSMALGSHAKPAPTARARTAPPASNAVVAKAPVPRLAPTPARPPGSPASTPASAVGHLIAGRYAEAQAAYASLPEDAGRSHAYAAVVRLLARGTGPSCSGPEASSSCPEVLP